jgi:hypothetical protein
VVSLKEGGGFGSAGVFGVEGVVDVEDIKTARANSYQYRTKLFGAE